ncbi:DUF1715-domain-containing protein [Dendrothele bispora CBS 962.96]|uniref:DUF1715-domain-containing protein n=1 Tax=Dendrothele bispora (strain CBS 962.96) TaxID=1314807 RepID=A0A4S8LNZ3_DENBC|nr:DUF1715-domain-containing protein [Dendrothele bispora CBS 962.96]
MSDFNLEALVHLEETFYDVGYQDGFAHGRIHGLIEGRALGREKGFEMWDEIGFYEGFALVWQSTLAKNGKQDERAYQHAKNLLNLVSRFPRVNPSNVRPAGPASEGDSADIPKLFRQIRSKYKALCSSVNVRPKGFDDPADYSY